MTSFDPERLWTMGLGMVLYKTVEVEGAPDEAFVNEVYR
jgi:hypothetical protein